MKSIALPSLAVCALLAFGASSTAQAQEKKADPNGTWTWTQARGGAGGGGGGAERKTTLTLKAEGEKLMGKVSTAGRDGQARETEISKGTIKGEDISFEVTVTRGDNSFTSKYAGKISADTIKGKIENTTRDGETRARDWEAKREPKK